MGVSFSVATIFVNFDQSSVEAGHPVTGTVYLSVNRAELACDSIKCRVLGQERTEVGYTVRSGSGEYERTERETACETRNFLDQYFELARCPQRRLIKGQYEYPFTFTVPASAPASMSASVGFSHCCKVAYSMHVWLDRPGMPGDIWNTRFVTVVRPVPMDSKVPLYVKPSRIELYSCGRFKRGNVLLGCAAESNLLYAGANTSVKYAAQNNSTVRIKAIEVILVEAVRFQAQSHCASTEYLCYRRRLSPEEAGLDLHKLNKQHGAEYDTMNDLRRLSEKLASDCSSLNFTVPSTARSTYNGSLIRVHHVLGIELITTFGTKNPYIIRDIQIFGAAPSQELKSAQLSSLPTNWAPSVATKVVLPTVQVSQTAAAGDSTRGDEKFTSFAQLIDAISRTDDPCGELETYLHQGNRADNLQPEEFFMLFKAVTDVFIQERFAAILAAAMTTTTCVKVARATAGAKDVCKREVAEKLLNAGRIMDKAENAHLVISELGAFQFLTVEKYFR